MRSLLSTFVAWSLLMATVADAQNAPAPHEPFNPLQYEPGSEHTWVAADGVGPGPGFLSNAAQARANALVAAERLADIEGMNALAHYKIAAHLSREAATIRAARTPEETLGDGLGLGKEGWQSRRLNEIVADEERKRDEAARPLEILAAKHTCLGEGTYEGTRCGLGSGLAISEDVLEAPAIAAQDLSGLYLPEGMRPIVGPLTAAAAVILTKGRSSMRSDGDDVVRDIASMASGNARSSIVPLTPKQRADIIRGAASGDYGFALRRFMARGGKLEFEPLGAVYGKFFPTLKKILINPRAPDPIRTLRHEGGHSFFSPLGETPLARWRALTAERAYAGSRGLRTLEEMLVEGYARRNPLEGFRFVWQHRDFYGNPLSGVGLGLSMPLGGFYVGAELSDSLGQ